jgi:arabinan endo-1,5-alpha-L-arabinosidase
VGLGVLLAHLVVSWGCGANGRAGGDGASGDGSTPSVAEGGGGADGRVGAGPEGTSPSDATEAGVVAATEGGPPGLVGSPAADGATPATDAAAEVGRPPSGSTDADAGGCGASLGAGPVAPSTTHIDVGIHDPSMIWDGSRYYLFGTGGTLSVRTSADLLSWTGAGNVFGSVPAWLTAAIGSTPTDLWAPDISDFNGEFHVYYAGSSFGSRNSAIGLATSATLASPTWVDRGQVVVSKTTDDFNAIDPSVSFDETCAPWLAYGSFWSGIKLHKLDASTGKLATDDPTTYAVASRNGGAIEGASIISHHGYFYLFVSFDACCKGVNSTYRTMVGRAAKITGPYTDKAGADMMTGAAEPLLATSGRYIGPGGGTAWRNGDTFLYAYHYYDGQGGGASKLQIRPITFDGADWIVLGPPLFP